ncbi:MAG: DotU family type IV/VI secretion system protein, partial [Lentisphaerota bacterium]
MMLSELCEPLFLYMCRLNRSARKGGIFQHNRVRSEIGSFFKDMAKTASMDPRLSEQYRKIEVVLLFFVDSMVSESALPFAEEWNQNRMAFERNELAGDEKFFDLLDETLADPSEQATERLAIFYTCLGL